MNILRANLEVNMALHTPAEVFADDRFAALLEGHLRDDAAPPGPDRAQLLAALAG